MQFHKLCGGCCKPALQLNAIKSIESGEAHSVRKLALSLLLER